MPEILSLTTLDPKYDAEAIACADHASEFNKLRTLTDLFGGGDKKGSEEHGAGSALWLDILLPLSGVALEAYFLFFNHACGRV